MENLKEYLLKEEKQAFRGWDFSYMDGRCDWGMLSWDYKDIVDTFRKDENQLLDIGTGGGEFILNLHHPYQNTSVTESWDPNYQLCLKRLAPLGITVEQTLKGEWLPFEDEKFDLVIDRHEAFLSEEVWRVLKPGGYFITQQVGSRNDRILVEKIMGNIPKPFPDHDLLHNKALLKNAGFCILEEKEEEPLMKLYDLGATVYFARQICWEFPDFSVEQYFPQVAALQKEIEEKGFIENRTHRFLLVAQKPE